MNFDYIIVQAGGKGQRLGYLTENKPKALVSVNNLPLIFHLFKKFPDKKYIIIGDYQIDVLRSYLAEFSEVKHIIVKAEKSGTCSGISDALAYIPDNSSFMLIWCDLILSNDFSISPFPENDYIGIAKESVCRWSYKDTAFTEISSGEHGVAGLFVFTDKKKLANVPKQGEFVKWLQNKEMKFNEIALTGMKEIGTLESYIQSETTDFRCRPFNQLLIENDLVIKKPTDYKGEELAVRECKWYQKANELGFKQIPHIISYSPLTMQRINGKNIFDLSLSAKEKSFVLHKVMDALAELHNLKQTPSDIFSVRECYFTKTMKRLNSVRNLIPLADKEFIHINGKRCKNVLFAQNELSEKITNLLFKTEFSFIHGDCTFSNTMIDENMNVVFIDPRGYFGFTELFGDVYYDWAKLYYSIVGNYDQFNKRNFRLKIGQDEIGLEIESNGWESVRESFFDPAYGIKEEKVELIHALIWLSLTTYTWNDYDSICGAFYNGLYYLEDIL